MITGILKTKKINTLLYDKLRGCNVLFKGFWDKEVSYIKCMYDTLSLFYTNDGKFSNTFPDGEVILVPSKEMQDWSKFAWKKGDVLTDEERFVVFKGFNTYDYTEFSAAFEYEDDACRQDLWFVTNDFRKVSDNVAQEVIKKVEEHYGGTLNLITLTIEQPKPEFKDGDIVVAKCEDDKGADYIVICKNITNYRINDFCSLNLDNNNLDCSGMFCLDLEFYSLHLATDSEKQQLFDALAKEGKRWNPETLKIEYLPKKCEFKPFQKVMVRDSKDEEWRPAFFWREHSNGSEYVILSGEIYNYCITYNDSTKHLLGTTDEWKG